MTPHIQLIRDKTKLEGTAYFEFFPGRYTHDCWNDTAVFLDEEIFGLIEESFVQSLPNYDHYAFCDVSFDQWQPVLKNLRSLGDYLSETQSPDDIEKRFRCVRDSTRQSFSEDFQKNTTDLIQLINEFTEWIEQTLQNHDTIAVLGM